MIIVSKYSYRGCCFAVIVDSTPLAQVGDRVGVKRLSNGSLIFCINGIEQGVAATNLPDQLYAVVDIYGQCSQVKLTTATQGTIIIAKYSSWIKLSLATLFCRYM